MDVWKVFDFDEVNINLESFAQIRLYFEEKDHDD